VIPRQNRTPTGQAITAVRAGCAAAIDAERWLLDSGGITANTFHSAGHTVDAV
jgi:hypothetical protein